MARKLINHKEVIDEFETLTRDAAKIQVETLRKILEKNGEAAYLQKLGLNGRTDPEAFKSCVPLVTYDDLQPYICRIMDGDLSNILACEPITTFSQSTGTTQGKPKYFPFGEQTKEAVIQTYKTSYAFREREFPTGEGKALQLIYSSKLFETKEGLTISTMSSNVFRSSEFKNMMKAMNSQSCSPEEVITRGGLDFHQPLYCHLLCGLLCREEIKLFYSAFAHNMILAFQMFGQVWEDLCNDIRNGILSSHITDPFVRDAMSKLLNSPKPELADYIHGKCIALEDNGWYGMVPELFPNVKYLYSIFTGGMEPYVPKLKHYTGGVVPLVSADYAASEGWIGANINPRMPPESVTFVVLPNLAYFEFIPLSASIDNDEMLVGNNTSVTNSTYADPEPVGLTEVKIGEEYEVVITNFYGLYRHKLGDIVRVKGFHNSSPELQYICRRNAMMSITIEKITERDVQLAVEEATKLLIQAKVELVDFTSHVHKPSANTVNTEEGHYVIFWEMSSEQQIDDVLQECCNFLDQFFGDVGYMVYRKTGQIGPLELRIVKRGTFRKILDHYLSLGASAAQFKTPRYVGHANKKVLQIVCDNVAKSFFSTAYN